MTFLRYSIYAGGGLLLTALFIVFAVFDPLVATQPWILWTTPVLCLALLYAFDRWIHSVLFGHRIVLVLEKYIPCPICPFTGKAATVLTDFVFSTDCVSPVHVIQEHRLPILISKEAAAMHQKRIIGKIPGIHVVRYTGRKAVLYIKDRQYYEAFVAANERAIG